MKKILSTLLCLCLFVTAFGVCACAAGNDEKATFWTDFVCDNTGEYWTDFVCDNTDNTETVRLGDVNQDGTVNSKDLLILRKAIVTETESTFVNADINGDSKVNLSDVLCLRILLAGGPYWSTF